MDMCSSRKENDPEGGSEAGKTATATMGSDVPQPVSRGDGTPTVANMEDRGPESVGLENGAWSRGLFFSLKI